MSPGFSHTNLRGNLRNPGCTKRTAGSLVSLRALASHARPLWISVSHIIFTRDATMTPSSSTTTLALLSAAASLIATSRCVESYIFVPPRLGPPRGSNGNRPPTRKTTAWLGLLGSMSEDDDGAIVDVDVVDDDDVVLSPSPGSIDESRRRFLLTSSLCSSSSLLLLLSNVDIASASSSTIADAVASSTREYDVGVPPQIDAAMTSSNAISRGGVVATVCADSAEEERIAIFERVAPSVVYIDTFGERRDAFTANVLEVPNGSGSGYVWDMEGHVVTNFHVVQDAKSARVAILTPATGTGTTGGRRNAATTTAVGVGATTTYTSVRPGAIGSDGSTVLPEYTRTVHVAKVVGVDPTKDIAVLKVDDVVGLRPILVGTSTGLRVGQGSLAIGNPFGLDHTLT